jgi:D-alanyl-lipoteichoic acid acyltransferase DltB (MBOAT superfamily)
MTAIITVQNISMTIHFICFSYVWKSKLNVQKHNKIFHRKYIIENYRCNYVGSSNISLNVNQNTEVKRNANMQNTTNFTLRNVNNVTSRIKQCY